MEEKRETVPLIKSDTVYKLVIPKDVELKIRYLCNRVWDKEWSGALFYKVEGSFEDGTLKVVCQDIFVMDIGNSVYTEFDMSPDVMSYMAQDPDLMDCQIGLVHSHNNMAAFFSGTDINTLKEEGMDRNHFVSLIVNNKGTYTAAITRRIKVERQVTEKIGYSSFDDRRIDTSDVYVEEDDMMQYFVLDIVKEGDSSFIDVDDRLKEISESKKAVVKPSYDTSYFKSYGIPENKRANIPAADDSYRTPVLSQPQLPLEFNDKTKDEKPMVLGTDCLKADPKLVRTLCMQLLTGSVMIPNESKIDIRKWVLNLDRTVTRRFGKDADGLKAYRYFIETMVEFLIWYTDDDTLPYMDQDSMAGILASDMYEFIDDLPENTCTSLCKDVLLSYVG